MSAFKPYLESQWLRIVGYLSMDSGLVQGIAAYCVGLLGLLPMDYRLL